MRKSTLKPSGSRSRGLDAAPHPRRKAAAQTPPRDRAPPRGGMYSSTPEPRDSPEPGEPPDDGNLERLLYTRAAPTADFWNLLCQHEHRLATLTAISLKGVFDAAVPGNQRDSSWSKTRILNALAVFLKDFRATSAVKPSELPCPTAVPEHPEQPLPHPAPRDSSAQQTDRHSFRVSRRNVPCGLVNMTVSGGPGEGMSSGRGTTRSILASSELRCDP